MQMHDRHDDDPARPFSEKDAERKGLGEASADIKFHDWVQAGIEDDAIDGVLHRREKPSAQVWLLSLVVRRSLDHLGFGIGMEGDDLHASEA